MKQVFHWFLNLKREHKRVITLVIDFSMLFFACWFAMSLRIGTPQSIAEHWIVYALAPLCALPVMIRAGLYRAVIRFVGYSAMWTVVSSVSLGVLIWALAITLVDLFMPRSSIIIYWMAALVFVGGTRIWGRWIFRQFTDVGKSYKNRHAMRALIYGAGASGQQMVQAFLQSKEVSPIGFLDDDKNLEGTEILGLRVFNLSYLEWLVDRYDIDTVLLSTNKLSSERMREIVKALEPYSISVKVVPSMGDVAQGKISVSDLTNIDVSDLLGRQSVEPRKGLLSECIAEKRVMVTGAGGSIGSELCRQILKQNPRSIVLFELTEFALYKIERELTQLPSAADVEIISILGNVQDKQQLIRVMQAYRIETVYHAAAYKHVPLVEHNVFSGVSNNVMGTWHTAEAAVAADVRNFVLVSTDKAVRPTNVMGATKRLAELVLQGIMLRGDHKTRFSMVRFGNVLGSSGSVIPLFKQQIKAGGPVTVTHPEVTRYFMTIPEAASLVIQAGAMGGQGEVFVLDMGESVKIIDLAKEMISLSGCSLRTEENPDGDIEIEFSGLRPGEKLFEELLIGDNVQGTDHPMIMRAQEDALPWDEMFKRLSALESCMERLDYPGLMQVIEATALGYQPETEIFDHLYVAAKEDAVERKLHS